MLHPDWLTARMPFITNCRKWMLKNNGPESLTQAANTLFLWKEENLARLPNFPTKLATMHVNLFV